MATASKKSPVVSEKAENFIRIGGRRVANALEAIRRLKNLSNRATYEYTPEQVEKICGALEAEAAALRQAFSTKDGVKAKGSFQL